VIRTDDRYQCVRVADGVVVANSNRQDIVQAQCSVAVETTRKAHDVKQPTLHLSYVSPTQAQPPAATVMGGASSSGFAMLAQICSDPASVGKQTCGVQPTRFDFPSAASVVKSDGAWSVFGSLADSANVLVCALQQTPGAAADPFRDLCGGDTYVAKGSVRLATVAFGTPPAATTTITVTQPKLGSALLSWAPPAKNTDGSTLTDLAGYRVLYGAANPPNIAIDISGSLSQYELGSLPPGKWYFAIAAKNSAGTFSERSSIVSKVIE
jgi:hypothetical protein